MTRLRRGESNSQASAPRLMRGFPTSVAALRAQVKRLLVRIRYYVPPGFRWLVGLLLICGGILGFLPVLGFWMIPLGVAVFLLDIKSLRQWWQTRHQHRP